MVLLLAAAAFGQEKAETWKDRHGREWTTTGRLLLDAATAKQALNGDVWVNNGGSHVAYIRKQGKQQSLVIDGKAQALHDGVMVCDRLRSRFFFAKGEHYAYIAMNGNMSQVVVDGRPGKKYRYIKDLHAYLSPSEFLWSYAASTKIKKGYRIVLNGKETHRVSLLAESILFAGRHSLFKDWVDDKYQVVFDGKKEHAIGFVIKDSLTLVSTGAYAYAGANGSDTWFAVVNGKRSPGYKAVYGRTITFSRDGTHVAFQADKGERNVIVVDGRAYPLPVGGMAHLIVFSPDGKHWACAFAFKAVLHDGKVVGSGYERIHQPRFSLDGAHLAYTAKKNGAWIVVVDGKEIARYHEAGWVTLSPDGRRLAFVARRAKGGKQFVVIDGTAGKAYDRIEGATLNFGLDGRAVSYVARVGERGDEGFLVIEGHEGSRFDRIAARPNKTLYIGAGSLSYVGVRGGAYYWLEERRAPK